ncbi:alpha-galactosidase [Eubacterium pyruvativorans]|uniref:alpha-galactosidase n=1 Tax=Eubacterium pyruvativorans TaxID=155865 RepID=A0A1I7FD44_9FIRM|nr:alpha-galactosidase [Eubacterium pyruvativorans]SFN85480.1 alpha-galactosidase [Eubacterium pyruvativorans]SFU34130.1 alpha-galactosidase [Eubacterium pyruvativorans]
MIQTTDNCFVLCTDHTTYAFHVLPPGHLEHLYYGPRIRTDHPEDLSPLIRTPVFPSGNTNVYSEEYSNYSLEDLALEMSADGKGDIRAPFLALTHGDGSSTSDFLYRSFAVTEGVRPMHSLPQAGMTKENRFRSSDGSIETLTVTLQDAEYELDLDLIWTVFPDCDVITRRAVLRNESSDPVTIRQIASLQIDFPDPDYTVSTFTGGWASEMERTDFHPVPSARIENASFTGTSSSRANPFLMLSARGAGETWGRVYGFNLVYSGNHAEVLETSRSGILRLRTGINPRGFRWLLPPGDFFETPEAMMTCSGEGAGGMSRNMHRFIRQYILPPAWRSRPRPVLLNTWEADYFNVSERTVLRQAKLAKKAGIELLVIDDGWFGHREDDTSSLGDWTVNRKKFPGGLRPLSEKLRRMGLELGIWTEPEMISRDSDLFRQHPDWALRIPGHPHSEGRRQMILDLTRSDVQEYLIETISHLLRSARISYVKWDMNRTFSDIYSRSLPADRQGEVLHRYMIGLYRCLDILTRRFPEILFEGCAAGGNRADPGMLCYFPQIWGSDNTDPLCRTVIQQGYSYGYPLSCISAHVSASPNHQTLRRSPLHARFAAAAFGLMGYELNLPDLTGEERNEIEEQIRFYKEWRDVFFQGDFYRTAPAPSPAGPGTRCPAESAGILSPVSSNYVQWTVVSEDRLRAVHLVFQKRTIPNHQPLRMTPRGLDPEKRYRVRNLPVKYDIRNFGTLVNTASPVHIRPGSLAERTAARFVKLPGEREDLTCGGDVLLQAGMKLAPGFAGVGLSDQVRIFLDCDARLYLIEAADDREEAAENNEK